MQASAQDRSRRTNAGARPAFCAALIAVGYFFGAAASLAASTALVAASLVASAALAVASFAASAALLAASAVARSAASLVASFAASAAFVAATFALSAASAAAFLAASAALVDSLPQAMSVVRDGEGRQCDEQTGLHLNLPDFDRAIGGIPDGRFRIVRLARGAQASNYNVRVHRASSRILAFAPVCGRWPTSRGSIRWQTPLQPVPCWLQGACAGLLAMAGALAAQDRMDKPVHIIVGLRPGGTA
jgi:hypothetical protein